MNRIAWLPALLFVVKIFDIWANSNPSEKPTFIEFIPDLIMFVGLIFLIMICLLPGRVVMRREKMKPGKIRPVMKILAEKRICVLDISNEHPVLRPVPKNIDPALRAKIDALPSEPDVEGFSLVETPSLGLKATETES